MDAWKCWRVLCLSVLSVEDVEDLYLFGFMITGFLLFGIGGYLVFREIRRLKATGGGLPVEPVYRSINTLTQTLCELSRKHDALDSKMGTMSDSIKVMSDSIKVMGNTLEKLVVRMEGN